VFEGAGYNRTLLNLRGRQGMLRHTGTSVKKAGPAGAGTPVSWEVVAWINLGFNQKGSRKESMSLKPSREVVQARLQ